MIRKRFITTPSSRSTRRVEQSMKVRRHDRHDKLNLFSDLHINYNLHTSSSPDSWPSLLEERQVPIRRLRSRVSKDNTCTGRDWRILFRISVFILDVTVKTGQHRPILEITNTDKMEVRQQYCPIRKIWKTDADQVRSQQKSILQIPSHRLNSRWHDHLHYTNSDQIDTSMSATVPGTMKNP